MTSLHAAPDWSQASEYCGDQLKVGNWMLQLSGEPPQLELVTGCQLSKMADVVTATWNSNGSSPFATRSVCACARAVMNALKLRASRACSGAIDPESSTTNRMSAVAVLASWTRDDPGWMTHFPTGLKL